MKVIKLSTKMSVTLAFILEMLVDIAVSSFLLFIFFTFPSSDEPVTHNTIRFQICLAVLILLSCSSAIKSWKRWRASQKSSS